MKNNVELKVVLLSKKVYREKRFLYRSIIRGFDVVSLLNLFSLNEN